jgi:hypothetical protein
VVSATFDLMETYSGVWAGIRGSEPVTTFGFQYAVGLEPVAVNVDRMLDRFVLGVRELIDIWRKFFPREIIGALLEACSCKGKTFRLADEVWVEILYHFALAQHNRILPREHLLKSLVPLYIGRIASFVLETGESSSEEVEQRIESLCAGFETGKSLLVDNWERREEGNHEYSSKTLY